MACGENPKRVYKQRGPSTRMGNVAGYRAQWIKAERYRREWDAWLADPKGDAPDRDLAMETLAEVLRGDILVQNHCYRADEMAQMIDIAHEFGYQVRSFHHAVEAYKIARPARPRGDRGLGLGRLGRLQDGGARLRGRERGTRPRRRRHVRSFTPTVPSTPSA